MSERNWLSVHPSRGRGGGAGSRRSVTLHPQAHGGKGGGGGGGQRRVQAQIQASLVSYGLSSGPKKMERQRSATDQSAPGAPERCEIDFRAPLSGLEHIVLPCLRKAALNYSVCLCAGCVCPSARVLEPHANWALMVWEKWHHQPTVWTPPPLPPEVTAVGKAEIWGRKQIYQVQIYVPAAPWQREKSQLYKLSSIWWEGC